MALDANIGCFVVDNFNELHLLNALAADKGKKRQRFASHYARRRSAYA